MGGYGSGRPGFRTAVEDTIKLDLASPATRDALKPGCWRQGRWTWSQDGEPFASIGYEWDGSEGASARLTLVYTADGEKVRQIVNLTRSRPRFGGWRWWFLCPVLAASGEERRVRALYLPPGRRRFASRIAYGLNYRSQKESRGLSRLIARLMRG